MRPLSPSPLALPLLLATLTACDGVWELAGHPTRPRRSEERSEGVGAADAGAEAPTDDASHPGDARRDTASAADDARDAAPPEPATRPDGAAGDDASPGPNPTPAAPNTCLEADFTCVSGDRLSWCDAGARVARDCDAICAARGYPRSNGCGTSAALGGDSCFCLETLCDDAPPACRADGRGLASCVGGEPVFTSCDAICDARGLGRALGCSSGGAGDAACLCEPPAPPPPACVEDALACADDGTLAQCERGLWRGYDCAALCGEAGFDVTLGCGFDAASGADACLCDVTPTCPHGHAPCDDGTCIDASWLCDGRIDCAGLEDEAMCSAAACVEGDSLCLDPWTIDSCSGGAWETWDCGEVCWQAGYEATTGCDVDASHVIPVDACFCTDL